MCSVVNSGMASFIKDVMQIECQAEIAFDLMADPRNELEWNSGVSEAELMSEGLSERGPDFGSKTRAASTRWRLRPITGPIDWVFWSKIKA